MAHLPGNQSDAVRYDACCVCVCLHPLFGVDSLDCFCRSLILQYTTIKTICV